MKQHLFVYYLSIAILILSSALTIYHWAYNHEWLGMCFIAIMSGIMVCFSLEEYDG